MVCEASTCWLQVGNAQGRNISEGTANVVEDDRWHMVSGTIAADCKRVYSAGWHAVSTGVDSCPKCSK